MNHFRVCEELNILHFTRHVNFTRFGFYPEHRIYLLKLSFNSPHFVRPNLLSRVENGIQLVNWLACSNLLKLLS